MPKPFRFAVQTSSAPDGKAWREKKAAADVVTYIEMMSGAKPGFSQRLGRHPATFAAVAPGPQVVPVREAHRLRALVDEDEADSDEEGGH